jgi:hypothetical protein
LPRPHADLANGEQIVRNICASCHGFPPQAGPNFAANHPRLINFALQNIPAMSFLRTTLSPNDVNDIAAYLGVLFGATPPPPPPAPDSYQGLWLKFPFESESGWGINFSHQGTTLFATWFTGDTDGAGMWLVMSNGAETAAQVAWATCTAPRRPAASVRSPSCPSASRTTRW